MGRTSVALREKLIIAGGEVSAESRSRTKSAPEISPEDTALHEAAHVLVAIFRGTGVLSADIIANGNIGGTTWTKRFDPVVLAAGAASGDAEHAGGDFAIAVANKVNWESAVSAAREILSGKDHILYALASAIEKWKKLGGGDLADIYNEAESGSEILITFTDAEGSSGNATMRVTPGKTEINIPIHILKALTDAHEREKRVREENESKRSNVVQFPRQRRVSGIEVDVVTEKDLSDLQRDV